MRLAIALLVLFPVPLRAQGILDQKPIQELRGAWIRASDDLFASREQISKSMEALADARFNVVLPCVFDGAYTLWHSPTAKEASGADSDPAYGERDVLSEILFEAHRFKLEVVPWFDAGFTAKGALLEKHPNWCALGKDRKPLVSDGLHWLDTLDPEVQQFELSLLLELARNFDIDGIAGSERFPGLPAAAVGKPAQLELFQKWNGGKPASDANDPKWQAWRAQQLTDFLTRVSGALRPSLAIVLAPRAAGPGPGELLQDVAGWSEKKCFHALVLGAAPQSAAEEQKRIAALLGLDWCGKHASELCAGIAADTGTWKADGALLQALVKSHRDANLERDLPGLRRAARERRGAREGARRRALRIARDPALAHGRGLAAQTDRSAAAGGLGPLDVPRLERPDGHVAPRRTTGRVELVHALAPRRHVPGLRLGPARGKARRHGEIPARDQEGSRREHDQGRNPGAARLAPPGRGAVARGRRFRGGTLRGNREGPGEGQCRRTPAAAVRSPRQPLIGLNSRAPPA